MAKFKSLSRGTQIVLVAAPLLFFSLFLTWQNIAVNYGRAGVARLPLDGWDAWGLLLGLLVLSTLTLVVLTNLTEVEMSSDVPWAKVTLGLGARHVRRRRPQEPHRRRLVLVELRVRGARGCGRSGDVPRLGCRAQRSWAAARRAEAPRDQINRLTSSARSSPGPS